MDEFDICNICHENFEEDGNNEYILECNHKYHSQCIIQWFRNGNSNCPLCNDIKIDPDLGYYTKICCVQELKKLGRRKSCPDNIKKILDKIKKANQEEKKAAQEYSEFKKENKDILKKITNMRNKKWTIHRKIRKLECELIANATLNPIYITK